MLSIKIHMASEKKLQSIFHLDHLLQSIKGTYHPLVYFIAFFLKKGFFSIYTLHFYLPFSADIFWWWASPLHWWIQWGKEQLDALCKPSTFCSGAEPGCLSEWNGCLLLYYQTHTTWPGIACVVLPGLCGKVTLSFHWRPGDEYK